MPTTYNLPRDIIKRIIIWTFKANANWKYLNCYMYICEHGVLKSAYFEKSNISWQDFYKKYCNNNKYFIIFVSRDSNFKEDINNCIYMKEATFAVQDIVVREIEQIYYKNIKEDNKCLKLI